jgi:hypothetical protein
LLAGGALTRERRWNNPSENRYTAQVRYANDSLVFDWLLSGDDDTIFLVDSAPAPRSLCPHASSRRLQT